MDLELREYLEAMERRMAEASVSLEQRMGEALQSFQDRTAGLIAGEVGSLHNEITGLERRIGEKLESIATRLQLQAGLIQGGARAMARFSQFAD